jgi:glyceraldehyde 3-phosphate dehydrogenase
MAYLLTYDSVHGGWKGVSADVANKTLTIEGQTIPVYNFKDPSEIPWSHHQVKYVAETSGAFTAFEKASKHIHNGDIKVVISAPAKDQLTPTFVVGVNHLDYTKEMTVVSCASCTTNCLAPLVKVVEDSYGIVEGLMTTVHATTATQSTVDGSGAKDDWRVGRSASVNIIPATTGAASALGKVIPSTVGKLNGMAFRVPTVDVSIVDLTCKLARPIASLKDISHRIVEANIPEIIGFTTDQVVSSDFRGDARSCIFDETASIMLNSTFVKLIAYYDNEYAYSRRMIDLIAHMNEVDSK